MPTEPKPKSARRLTALQARFVMEYLAGGGVHGAKAYVRAGGAASGAYTHASRMLRLPQVRARLDEEVRAVEQELRDQHLAVQRVTFDRALVDPIDAYDASGDLLPLHKMPAALRRAVKKISVVYREKEVERDDGVRIVERVPLVAELTMHDTFPDRQLALRLAGKLKERVELTGKDGAPLQVDFSVDLSRKDEA